MSPGQVDPVVFASVAQVLWIGRVTRQGKLLVLLWNRDQFTSSYKGVLTGVLRRLGVSMIHSLDGTKHHPCVTPGIQSEKEGSPKAPVLEPPVPSCPGLEQALRPAQSGPGHVVHGKGLAGDPETCGSYKSLEEPGEAWSV